MDTTTPTKSWFRRHPIWSVLGAFFILGIIGNIISPPESRPVAEKSETKAAAKPVEVTKVTPDELSLAYKDNEISADATYKGKLVEITAPINSLGKDVLDKAYIAFSAGSDVVVGNIQCMFSKSEEESLMQLHKGDRVTVQGKVSGKFGNVLLDGCKIIK